MARDQRPMAAAALWAAATLGGLAAPGCADDRTTTGTSVMQTPEQKAAEKASMEGMKKAMEQMKSKSGPR